MSDENARITADVLVWADLRGADTHGVARIPRYVEMIEAEEMNPKPAMRVRKETAASVLIDADRAAGPVAMASAMSAAVRKARDVGVGVALVRATTQTASLGYYTEAAAREGMAAIALAGPGRALDTRGARAPAGSPGPNSIAVPGGDGGPVVLDVGSAVVALGRLLQNRKAERRNLWGRGLYRGGYPTVNTREAPGPLSLGGPKRLGVSLLIHCVSSMVVARPLLGRSLEGGARGGLRAQNGLAIAIDVARFCDPATFGREVGRLANVLRGLAHDPRVDEILAPGAPRNRTLERRSRDGIPIPHAIVDKLKVLAERLGVPMFPCAPHA
jgi:LDH2 family malate/lactate/ureidoglycolate dehydrogenase